MSFRIFTDATSDLPASYAEELNITVIPMLFTLDNQEYQYVPGRSDMPIETFFEKMKGGAAPTTAQINTFTFVETFEPVLAAGEDVLYLGFSSALSGTVQSAIVAADELMARYPGRRVAVVDSLCASLGEGLFVYYVARKAKELDFEALVRWAEENKRRFVHWFTVDDLVYLKRGGRIGGATAAIATVLNIKPVMHVDDEGRLVAVSKAQGRMRSLRAMFENMVKSVDEAASDTVFIGNCACFEDAEFLASLIREKYPNMKVVVDTIGTSIGAHSGPGTVALFFVGSPR